LNPEEIEIRAMHNDPLPSDLKLPEQLLFLSFRSLYQSYRAGQLTRERAHNEKVQLLNQFADWMRWDGIYQDTCRMRVELSGMSKEVESGDCERCKRMMRIFDRRE
jgi:hypothetical protein